ncbi:MAG: NAD(P)H-hydrate dehydratase [Pseudomonadales bacterium]|nr:NAD(P)H-hydrate dehydratase [Pseudomonadales bacterium]
MSKLIKKYINKEIKKYLQNIKHPSSDSHKGQNGKLLLIGGSELFHAASKWSLDVASKFVDMVFYSSVPENNQLINDAKGNFWNGIVIPRSDVEDYINEADCILIGPGMKRDEETKKIVDYLVGKYSQKKWVIDAGALQVIDPSLLKINHIITPHTGEMVKLKESFKKNSLNIDKLQSTILLKGKVDKVFYFENNIITKDTAELKKEVVKIDGGNAGMTKGGSGDSLAGLVASLYCNHDAITSAVVGSYINKKAGDELYKTVGPYFNTSQLVEMIPRVFWAETN